MEYQKFLSLVGHGEKRNVDYKIICDAFTQNGRASNAELAKDICAMANNGNISSFIIIGVSDDGKNYCSVQNRNLTDDKLQDFCKKSIYPPPKVHLERIIWENAAPEHKNKEFVIIHIGPHKRQAFHLHQDFLYYDEKVCYRKNEVWIRRGATSDIATPDEVARLVKGELLEETPQDIERNAERQAFGLLAIIEKRKRITQNLLSILVTCGYSELADKHSSCLVLRESSYSSIRFFPRHPFWKRYDTGLFRIEIISCQEKVLLQTLKTLTIHALKKSFHEKLDLPEEFIVRKGKKINNVRRIWLIPVLASIPNSRIQNYYQTISPSGIPGHFYFRTMDKFISEYGKKPIFLASSTELLFIDKFESESDFMEKTNSRIKEIEAYSNAIVNLPSE